jgi:hypothetical protein
MRSHDGLKMRGVSLGVSNWPHRLPITALMRVILEPRCLGLKPDDVIYKGVSAEQIHRTVAFPNSVNK